MKLNAKISCKSTQPADHRARDRYLVLVFGNWQCFCYLKAWSLRSINLHFGKGNVLPREVRLFNLLF